LKLEAEERERDKAREAELDRIKLDLEARLELKRLQVSQTQNVPVVGAAPALKLKNAIKLLPKFNEQNVEEYLNGFEKLAEINNWPQDSYASVLHAMLVGKGLKVFAELSTEDCKDYSKLKAALLNAYSVVSEVHRSRFRNCMKQPTETYSDFVFVLGILCKRWLEAEQAYDNFERMREVIKHEQFYERIHPDLHSWLLDKNPKTLTEAAKLADEYNAVRKTHMKTQKTGPVTHTENSTD